MLARCLQIIASSRENITTRRDQNLTKRNDELEMQNDKAFIYYAIGLAVGIGTVLAMVVSTGASHVPEPMYLVEHVSLGLMVRAYYKSFDGTSGFYALANGVKSYFGLAREAIPSSAIPLAH